MGIIRADLEIVAEETGENHRGTYLTFVVSDVDALFEEMQKEKQLLVQAQKDIFYGQGRMLVKDADEIWPDISSPIRSNG